MKPKNRKFGILRPVSGSTESQNMRRDKTIHMGFKDNEVLKAIMAKKPSKCHFCEFHDEYFLEPHHLDGDHTNHTDDNVVAACTLCHAQNHIFGLALDKKAEICVLSADISQEVLNQLQRTLLVLSHKSDHIDIELSNFARRHRQELFLEPLKRHQRPNPAKISDAEYTRLMFEDIQAFNAIKTRTQNIDTNLYFTHIKFNNMEEYEEAKQEDTLNANVDFVDQLRKYKDWYLSAIKENKNFSLYQLAKSLALVTDEAYEDFELPNHFIVFSPSIFTNEQYEYYQTLDVFKNINLKRVQ